MRNTALIAVAFGCGLLVSPVYADNKSAGRGSMNHGEMKHDATKMEAEEAAGVGVINSLDAEKKMINITHDPMPELGWPVMTMDLLVTKKIDLTNVNPGEKVNFKLKLGRDKKYRVIEISPAK